MNKLFKVIRGLSVIVLIVFIFSPFSVKDSPIENNGDKINALAFNEAVYLNGLSKIYLLYKEAIDDFKQLPTKQPSMQIVTQVNLRLTEEITEENKKKWAYTALKYKPSTVFQAHLQRLAKQLNTLNTEQEFTEKDIFKNAFFLQLEEISKILYQDPLVKEEEKIAFRMMHLDQLVLHDIYMEIGILDRLYIYSAKNEITAQKSVQKEMPRMMMGSLWHTSAMIEKVQPNILTENDIFSLTHSIKHQHLIKTRTALFD